MKKVDEVKVSVRVDKELKESADSLFLQLGMNMTTAINLFLRKAVSESAIPFDISIKSRPFVLNYTIEDITDIFQKAVKDEIRNKLNKGNPVVEYDGERKEVYLLYPDGKKKYVNDER